MAVTVVGMLVLMGDIQVMIIIFVIVVVGGVVVWQ